MTTEENTATIAPPSMPGMGRNRKQKKEKAPRAPRAKLTEEERREKDLAAAERAEAKARKLRARAEGKLTHAQLERCAEQAAKTLRRMMPSLSVPSETTSFLVVATICEEIATAAGGIASVEARQHQEPTPAG